MSREIKFRAWDRQFKIMTTPQTLEQWCWSAIDAGQADQSNYEVMQFTGMLDKNGVEIYEGDILSEPISPVGGKNGGYLYESRVIKWIGASRGYGLYAPYAASEVLGNIHENPELLNE